VNILDTLRNSLDCALLEHDHGDIEPLRQASVYADGLAGKEPSAADAEELRKLIQRAIWESPLDFSEESPNHPLTVAWRTNHQLYCATRPFPVGTRVALQNDARVVGTVSYIREDNGKTEVRWDDGLMFGYKNPETDLVLTDKEMDHGAQQQ